MKRSTGKPWTHAHYERAKSWSTVAARPTVDERAAWAKAARKDGKSLAAWVRDTCNLAALGYVVPIERLRALEALVRKLSNVPFDLSQLDRK